MKLIHRTRWGAAVAVAALVMAGATSAQATLGGGTINAADGNLVADPAGDWANAGVSCTDPPGITYCGLDKASGSADDSFTQGTSEDTAVPVIDSGSIPPNKSDLTRFYAKIVTEANGKDYAYLAWERVQAPSGTTNMDFELNQSTQKSTNNVTPVRTAGDYLIQYDLSKGGTHPTISYSIWRTAASQGACEQNNSYPCWGSKQTLQGSTIVEAAVNNPTDNPTTGVVVDPINPGAPRSLDPFTFGEAAINLTDSGIIPSGTCTSIGQAYLKSRSSDSFTSALKDFVAPIAVNFNKCGKITIVKNTVGANGTFGYTATGLPAPNSSTFSLTTTNNTASTSFTNLFNGTYTFDETSLPTGWTFTSLACTNAANKPVSSFSYSGTKATVNLVGQGDVTCTYTNTAQATLNIAKVTDPATDTTTSFSFTGPNSDSGSTTNGGTPVTRANLSPGTYTWSETAKSGWDLTGISCTDQTDTSGASTVNTATASATFNLQPGENVTCTFTNRQRGTINVHKQDDSSPAAALAGAVFTLYTDAAPVGGAAPGAEDTSTGATCTTNASGDCSFTNVVPGAYWVVETTTPSGYTTAAPQAVTVGSGATVPLTFTDPRQFTIIAFVCKNADNSLYGSSVTFSPDQKTSISDVPSALAAKGVTEADLCGLGGATFSPRNYGSHDGNVTIPQ